MYPYLETNKKTIKGFPSSSAVENLPATQELQETPVQSLGGEDPLEEGNSLQYSCLENSHGQRGLEHYSPQVHKESDKTEATEHTCTREATTVVLSGGFPDF